MKKNCLHKVVVRTQNGKVIPGFSDRNHISDRLKIRTQEGEERTFRLDELKAVFFVKDIRGNSKYREIKFLNKQQISSMIWVRLEFFDHEVLEGKIPNNIELLSSPGFYLWPSDPDSNNDFVYVMKSCLKSFTILHPVVSRQQKWDR